MPGHPCRAERPRAWGGGPLASWEVRDGFVLVSGRFTWRCARRGVGLDWIGLDEEIDEVPRHEGALHKGDGDGWIVYVIDKSYDYF